MDKIENKKVKLCSNMVKFKTIADVCSISRGRVMSKDYIRNNSGDYPVYSSQTENNGELGKILSYDFDGEYLTWTTDGANAGSVFYRNGKFSVTNVCGLLKVIDTEVNTKFLYYVLAFIAPNYVNAGMGNPKLMSNVMARIKVPVPPLEVQYEIVRILDSFTLLSTELSSKISAEIKARQKQYQYYKDQLYSFKGKDVEYARLGDISQITRGGNFQKKDFVEVGMPCIHYGQIYTKYGSSTNKTLTFISEKEFTKSKKAQKNDIVMAVTSENIEDVCKCVVWLGEEEIAVSGHAAIIHHKINPKYLGYYFSTEHFFKQKLKLAHGTKVIEVTPNKLNDILIPLPSLEEQEKIANLVEKFEIKCSDILDELSTEIEKRQKQYEYYRDKLLSFKEVEVNE